MTDTKIRVDLPHWDMTPLYPALDSPEFNSAFDDLVSRIGELRPVFDAAGVRKSESSEVTDEVAGAFDDIITRLNEIAELGRTVRGYLYALHHNRVAQRSRARP